jgi:hypothetical protein
MKNHKKKNRYFNSDDIIQFALSKSKTLISIAFLAAVISFALSYTIKPLFKSTVILFPTTSTSIAKTLLNRNAGIKESMMQYGEDEDAERILQVLNSDLIRNKIISRFDLMNHYEIDTTKKYPKTKLIKRFKENIKVKRTKYMAIEIDVYDHKPAVASDIANYAALLVDTIMNDMYRERSYKAFLIVEKEYQDMERQMKALRDSIQLISSYGISDYESQAEVFNAEYAKAISSGNGNAARELKKKIEVLEKHGGTFLAFKNLLEFESERFSDLKSRYTEAKVDAFESIPYKYILDNADIAEKKAKPKRLIIMLVSSAAAFLFTLIILLITNKNEKN